LDLTKERHCTRRGGNTLGLQGERLVSRKKRKGKKEWEKRGTRE